MMESTFSPDPTLPDMNRSDQIPHNLIHKALTQSRILSTFSKFHTKQHDIYTQNCTNIQSFLIC